MHRDPGHVVDHLRVDHAALTVDPVVRVAEIAGVIAFLASDEASGVSGQAITVALGGLT